MHVELHASPWALYRKVVSEPDSSRIAESLLPHTDVPTSVREQLINYVLAVEDTTSRQRATSWLAVPVGTEPATEGYRLFGILTGGRLIVANHMAALAPADEVLSQLSMEILGRKLSPAQSREPVRVRHIDRVTTDDFRITWPDSADGDYVPVYPEFAAYVASTVNA